MTAYCRKHSCCCRRCSDPATGKDDAGVWTCDACRTYIMVGASIVCSCQTGAFTVCHKCAKTIDWGCIMTGNPGEANYITGDCGCGRDAWRNEEDGGSWGRYSYEATP